MKKIKPFLRLVNYYETDRMGIVHHSNYARWFEEARIDYMRQVDLNFDELGARGLDIPVLSISCVFKKPTTFNQMLAISPILETFNGVRFWFRYEVRFVADNELAATGNSSHCFVTKDMKPVNMKKHYPDLYEKMYALCPNPI